MLWWDTRKLDSPTESPTDTIELDEGPLGPDGKVRVVGGTAIEYVPDAGVRQISFLPLIIFSSQLNILSELNKVLSSPSIKDLREVLISVPDMVLIMAVIMAQSLLFKEILSILSTSWL